MFCVLLFEFSFGTSVYNQWLSCLKEKDVIRVQMNHLPKRVQITKIKVSIAKCKDFNKLKYDKHEQTTTSELQKSVFIEAHDVSGEVK